jgi:uncharacterized protein
LGKSALIFWGGWEGHTPERSARQAREMLERNGFAVRVEPGTAMLTGPDLGGLDLIVPVMTMASIEQPELNGLLAAVRGGSGLAGFHGSMCDSFRKEPDYQFMTGGQWVAHPGNIIDYQVDITKLDDPVMRGLKSFAYRSEQYYMHVDPSNDVLATTTFTDAHFPGIGGVVMPVVWKRRYGAGRVFHSSLGHTADEFQVPEMATIFERGALWAAR